MPIHAEGQQTLFAADVAAPDREAEAQRRAARRVAREMIALAASPEARGWTEARRAAVARVVHNATRFLDAAEAAALQAQFAARSVWRDTD